MDGFYVYRQRGVGRLYVQKGICGSANPKDLLAKEISWEGLRDVALANVPECRLVKAQFRVQDFVAFREAYLAFVSSFPSLETLRPETVWAMARAGGEDELEAAVEAAKKELVAQEDAATFPGRVSASRKVSFSTAYPPLEEIEIVVAPWVGDRVFRIFSGGVDVVDMEVVADYSARPSLSAAAEMRRLSAVAEIYHSASVFGAEKFPEDLPFPRDVEWVGAEPAEVSV